MAAARLGSNVDELVSGLVRFSELTCGVDSKKSPMSRLKFFIPICVQGGISGSKSANNQAFESGLGKNLMLRIEIQNSYHSLV